MIFDSFCEADTFELGVKIGKEANPGNVYTLIGDLGVGKTALTKGVAKGLEITEPISSPTFTIVNEYKSDYMKEFSDAIINYLKK